MITKIYTFCIKLLVKKTKESFEKKCMMLFYGVE